MGSVSIYITILMTVAAMFPSETTGTFQRGCMASELQSESINLYCEQSHTIQVINVTFERTTRHGMCHGDDVSPLLLDEYYCHNLSVNTMDSLNGECLGEYSCDFDPKYPVEDDCSDNFAANRLIYVQVEYICVSPGESSEEDEEEEDLDSAVSSRESTEPTASVITAVPPTNSSTQTQGNASATTNRTGRGDDKVIGVAVGGAFAGVMATIIVVLIIVFISRKRSRSKSSALRETISMDTTLGTVTKQSNTYMYDRSKGFEDSLAGEYNNSGFYMEIEDADVEGQNTNNHSAVVHTNSTARGRRQSDTYQEISDLHMDRAKVGPYEEILDIVTDLPSGRDSMTYDTLDDVKAEASGHGRDSSAANPCAGLESQNSLLDNPHRQLSIVKSTDEIVLQENDLYEGGDATVFEENDIYEGDY